MSAVLRPAQFPVLDQHARPLRNLRLSVTDRCNLRCAYCMPEEHYNWLPKTRLLSFEEISRVVDAFCDAGVDRIRLTGGEPLLRRDLSSLIELLASKKALHDIALTTNGVLLEAQAEALRESGLQRVTVSLDSLRPERFHKITKRNDLAGVLQGIGCASQLAFSSLKIDTVVMRGFNDDELDVFCELTKDNRVTVRFIEFMPFDANQIWETGEHFLSAETMIRHIKGKYPDIELASGTRTEHHIFQVPGYKGKIAIIPAFTRSLCGNCSRIRLTADGGIRNCLYSDEEFTLMSLIRNGCSDEDIVAKFRQAFKVKSKDGFESRKKAAVSESTIQFSGRSSMTQIGG